MTTLFDLYREQELRPARNEAEWQERHSELPLDSDVYAGDGYSTQRYPAQRVVKTEHGEVLRWFMVDEFGRKWLDENTLWPIEVYP